MTYIDLTEEYNDLKELESLKEEFEKLPELIEEGANNDIMKAFIKYRQLYTEEAKQCRKCLKEKKFNDASRHARNMKPIIADMKKEISLIDSNTTESVFGTCLAAILSMVQITTPVLALAAGFAIGKFVPGGDLINIGITGAKIYAGKNSSDVDNILKAIKALSQDIKAYKKANYGLEMTNGFKVKMISYCNRLSGEVDILIKQIKATKIMES